MLNNFRSIVLVSTVLFGAPLAAQNTIADIVVAASGGATAGVFDNDPRDYDILLNALTTANLVGAVADPDASLTVFAPNDAAFLALTGLSSEQEALDALVADLAGLEGVAVMKLDLDMWLSADDIEKHDLNDHPHKGRGADAHLALGSPLELQVDFACGLGQKKQAAEDEDDVTAGDVHGEEGEERFGQAHDPGEGKQQPDSREHGHQKPQDAGARLLGIGKSAGQN